ncbi:glycosyltransferase family 39 protein [Humibacillus xanthopallidus]|uniref:glycosyltransferase family 39 protein n=1 Tax=Humibacillus xanthopallidus TaxID=412689 RepID=UPI00384C57E6
MTVPARSGSALPERPPRRERWLAAVACLALAGLYLAIAARFGALGVSRNDDWTYYRVAFDAYAEGGFSPDPFTSTMLVGLIALATPVMAVFGPSMAALQVMVAICGAVGLWAAWLLIRRFLGRVPAALAVATLALGPLWGTLSTTFMSDVPAFTFQALALASAAVALRGPRVRWAWFAGSLVLCFAALTIREYAVASTIAVVVVALVRARSRRDRAVILGAGAVWVAAALALLAWRAGLVTGSPSRPVRVPGPEQVKVLVRTIYTTGLLMSPVAVLVVRRDRGAFVRRHWVAAATTGGVLLAGVVATEGSVLLGNYVTASGSYPETVGGPQPVVVTPVIWVLVVAVTVLSTTILATVAWAELRGLLHRRGWALLLARLRAAPPELVLSLAFTVTMAAIVLAIGVAVHNRIFDRYLMPITPYAAAVILWTIRHRLEPGGAGPRSARVATVGVAAGLVVLAGLGTSLVVGSAALDGAKWRLGERAVSAGFAAETVDAGLEWFGFHQTAPIVMQPTTLTESSFWVTALFEDPHVCALSTYLPQETASGPATDPTVPGQGPVIAAEQVWAPLGPGFELALRRTDLNCPAR